MKKILVALLCLLMFMFGMIAGAWQTYAHITPIVEERVVRDMNYNMADAGIRKYRFATDDNGRVRLIVKR